MTIEPPTDWLQTFTGKAFYPLRPDAALIDLRDIAHALSNLCRYGGHTREFYSVAEHSVLLSYAVPDDLKRWAILHDATEAYLVDIPRPLKRAMPDYKEAERRLMRTIAERFGLAWPEPPALSAYDTRILQNERRALFGTPPQPWATDEIGPPLPGITPTGWTPRQAAARFLARAHELEVL